MATEQIVAQHVIRARQELHDIHITIFFKNFAMTQHWIGNEAVLHLETIPMVLHLMIEDPQKVPVRQLLGS